MRRSPWRRVVVACVWLVLALAALYQISLLVQAIAGRVLYPYDLEWMEGGMLQHAQRIRHGEGIYVPPSVDFIPYLYTPLYPTLIAAFSALFGGPFGPSYLVGRAISIAALAGIAGAALASSAGTHERRLPVVTGAVLGLGLFAACYPFVEGWYDIVRADTLFLFMVTAGIAGLPKWAASDDGVVGHGKVCAGAALMALAFFCKQTGIIYVAFGGLIEPAELRLPARRLRLPPGRNHPNHFASRPPVDFIARPDAVFLGDSPGHRDLQLGCDFRHINCILTLARIYSLFKLQSHNCL